MAFEKFSSHPPRPRPMGRVNWLGLWTLYRKEVMRFINVFTQTLAAPVVTALLFFAIFNLALGRAAPAWEGVTYEEFLAPGLIMMTLVQNAFANTSSSILISKVQGNIVDVLMPPLAPWELTIGFAMGGVSRGMLVAFAVFLGLLPFAPISVHSPLVAIYFAFMASLMLSLLGMIGGIWAEKFDHIAAVTNFVITPLSFLSGTFYSLDRLPENWHIAAHVNPFFYMIDGLRYGFTGYADGNVMVGALLVLLVNVALFTWAHRMMATGYKLKA
ncbi:ABC transporter permease [Rhodovibrio salinarum]|nr:ABC transporter permease [Rhodovibrio salinarum]